MGGYPLSPVGQPGLAPPTAYGYGTYPVASPGVGTAPGSVAALYPGGVLPMYRSPIMASVAQAVPGAPGVPAPTVVPTPAVAAAPQVMMQARPALPQITPEALAALPPQAQKQQLGERLYALSYKFRPDLAAKITGMMLELDNSEILGLLESDEKLRRKIEEAVGVL